MPNEDLVGRAIRGDKAAFGLLYERHLDAIFRYVYFRVGNSAEAEDLTEDVFVNAWEGLSGFERGGRGSFLAWLYRIAHNRIIDHYRKRQPQSWSSEQLALEEAIMPSVEDSVHLSHDADRLAQAISKLEDTEQQVIILRFIEGLSHAEVAQIISKSEGASRIIQHRALSNLRALLGSV
jgi:RNA polymerase sigma-70 factor (ECF subfamily)